jgi:hypothetical protein
LIKTSLALAALGVVVFTIQAAGAQPAAIVSRNCPKGVVDTSVSLGAVVAQAERLLPAYLHTRGHSYRIIAAVRLAPNRPPTPGASALKPPAIRKCGRWIAERSWGLVVQVDLSPPAGGPSPLFIAKTRRGWRLYAGSLGR